MRGDEMGKPEDAGEPGPDNTPEDAVRLAEAMIGALPEEEVRDLALALLAELYGARLDVYRNDRRWLGQHRSQRNQERGG